MKRPSGSGCRQRMKLSIEMSLRKKASARTSVFGQKRFNPLFVTLLGICLGFLKQFSLDDKGATFLAFFGLERGCSHEHEADFAIQMALDTKRDLEDISMVKFENPLSFRISLCTGKILLGIFGTPVRLDMAILGEPIIIAVRFLKLENYNNCIFCDIQTRNECSSICDFADLGTFQIKGKPVPIQVYQVLPQSSLLQSSDSSSDVTSQCSDNQTADIFVGYDEQFKLAARILDRWKQTKMHSGIVVAGPSGIGKSTFSRELLDQYGANKNIYIM